MNARGKGHFRAVPPCTSVLSIGKIEFLDFSETIEACDLKVGRCRQLIELMKGMEGQGHLLKKPLLKNW